MKKKLFLLPLIGGLLLSGCTIKLFGKEINIGKKDSGGDSSTPTDTTDDSEETGGGMKGDTLIMNFTSSYWKDEKVFPRVEDNETLCNFTFDNVKYNDKGCYASVYTDEDSGETNRWLMMKNKWVDGKVAEGEEFAFIGNAASYGKAIKSIDVEVSPQTGGVDFIVAFGSSAFTVGPTSGAKKYSATASTKASFSATCSDGSQFWAISATRPVNQYRKNGGIAKITVHF